MAGKDKDADKEKDDAAEGEEGGEGGAKRGKKMGLIIIAVVVLLGAGAGAAYFFGLFDSMLGKGAKTEEHAEEAKEGEHGEPAKEGEGHGGAPAVAKITYYELPEFLVNLSGSTNQTSFLKMKITLEIPSEEDLLKVQEKLPLLQDHFNSYLRDLRASDLSGSAGMYRLREELLLRANKSVEPAKVTNILFKEILIQ